MAATTIQQFMTQAGTMQFSRDFLFRVKQISLIHGEVNFNGEGSLLYARSAKFPGRDIENKIVNYFGQQFNVSGKSSYPGSESYTIEFYHDENVVLRRLFEYASRLVFNNETSTGDYAMKGDDCYIELEVINKQLECVQVIKLIGVDIRKVGEVEHAIADGTGEINKIKVDFSYHYYIDINRSDNASN